MPFITVWISRFSDSGTSVWPSFAWSMGGDEMLWPEALWAWKFEKLLSRVNLITFSGVGGYVSPVSLALALGQGICERDYSRM